MKLDKHVVDMFTELTKPADDVKMEKTCYGTISVVDGTRYVKLDGSDLLVPAASTVKTSHGDRVTVLMKNHSLTVTGNLTAPATDGEGGSSGEAGTAATIEVGTVTTGEAGSSAAVTNSGTTSAAVFDFVIPRGDKGEKGDPGPQGPQGEKGDTGTWDGTIPDHEHTVSDITDFPTSLPANGGNADTVDGKHASDFSQVIDFGDTPTDTKTAIGIPHSITTYRCTSWTDYPAEAADGQGTIIAVGYYGAGIAGTNAMWVRQLFISPHYNHNKIWQRIVVNTTIGEWINIADGGNADTLDGKHASDFALSTNPTIEGEIHLARSGNATTSSTLFAWEDTARIRNTDTSAENTTYTDLVITSNGIYTEAVQDGAIIIRTRINDGGNADTVDGLHANEIASNPNLLINPDFKINQRGKDSYTGTSAYTYTVDRWCIWKYNCDAYGTVTVNNDGSLSVDGVNGANDAILTQELENGAELVGKTVTLSLEIEEIAGSIIVQQHYNASSSLTVSAPGIHKVTFEWQEATKYRIVINNTNCSHYKIKWAKLEPGSIATPFIPPDPATELAKCQRYYQRLSGFNTTYGVGFIGGRTYATINIALANPMRIAPTIAINGEVCVATANHNGKDGVIRTSTWVSGWHSTPRSATVVVDISSANDVSIVGNACLLQIRDADSYIELSAEL